MNKFKNILLVVISIYSIALTITHCNRENVRDDPSDNYKGSTDTVYRILKIPSKLDQEVKPTTVTLPPNLPIFSGTEVPNTQDSVAAVELKNENLSLYFQDSLQNLSRYDFKINLDKYHYLWVDGSLTSKEKSFIQRIQVKPYIGVQYRWLNQMIDVEGGLKIKLGNLNTTLGIQGYHYPNFQDNPGWDIKIGIQYEF